MVLPVRKEQMEGQDYQEYQVLKGKKEKSVEDAKIVYQEHPVIRETEDWMELQDR